MRHWLFLSLAIAAEVTGTTLMKWGSTSGHPGGLLGMFVLLALSYYALSLAVQRVPVGVAYAIWEGVGIVSISLISLMWFNETLSPGKAVGIVAVLGGIVLLKRGIAAGRGERAAPGARVLRIAPALRITSGLRISPALQVTPALRVSHA